MPVRVRGCVHPRGLPGDWYKGIKYLRQKEILEKVLSLPGTQSLDEHDPGTIGRVIGSYVDPHGQIFVDIEIADDTPEYERIKDDLVSGKYQGLSLGRKHKIDMDTGELVETNIFEVSVCEHGAVPGTYIEAVSVASLASSGTGSGVFGLPPVVDVTVLTVIPEEEPRQLTAPDIPGEYKPRLGKDKRTMSTTHPSPQQMLQTMAAPVLGMYNSAKAAASQGAAPPAGEPSGDGTGVPPPFNETGATPVPSTTSPAGGDAAPAAAAEDAAPPGTPADPSSSEEEQRGTKRPNSEKAVIEKSKYEALLEQQQEMKRLKIKMESQEKEINEWRSLRELTGSSKASDIAARVASARHREIDEFKGQVDEALPLIEKRYRETTVAEQNFIRPYLDSFRQYADNPEKVSLDAMNAARGFMDLITGQAREYNTSIAEKDAHVKSLEARCAASADRAAEADQRLHTLVSTSSAKRKTIPPFNPEEHGLNRTPAPSMGGGPEPSTGPTTSAPPSVPTSGPTAPNAFSSFGSGSVFGGLEAKTFKVYHAEHDRKEEIEATPFHFRPEEQYLNYFPPDQQEDAFNRAAPAEKLFSDIGRSHGRYYTTTPMQKLFHTVKDSEMGNLRTIGGDASTQGSRPSYYGV